MGSTNCKQVQTEQSFVVVDEKGRKDPATTWVPTEGSRVAGDQYLLAAPAMKLDMADAIPEVGSSAKMCKGLVMSRTQTQVNPYLNTSSYVNVYLEQEEKDVATEGLHINLADSSVYPKSTELHDKCVNMVAELWNCPKPSEGLQHAGAGTIGSTEACLLAGLCLKFRWRKWYQEKEGLTAAQTRAVYPNIVISTMYQACWEKFFKYFDVEARLVPTPKATFAPAAADYAKYIDDKTIGVVCILGNHYGGQYDDVAGVDKVLQKVNEENGWQVGIHVDGASGGFIAPFQDGLSAWDFRVPSVLSVSASGHKFGESCCGTGWVVWRQREGLSEHVAISVSYLGGSADSYTLNFSRPASGTYVQFYKFYRLGKEGYRSMVDNQMANAKFLRDALKNMKTADGKPWFTILDAGDTKDLPVVTAQLNKELKLPFNDIDLQHALAASTWYVSGYSMSFTDPNTEDTQPLFSDAPATETMFRVVVKANLTRSDMNDLAVATVAALDVLKSLGKGLAKSATVKHHHGAC